MTAVIVTGTDTGVGKTVFSAGLTAALGARYWKPVQSGLEEETDSQIVARLSGQPVLPEAYLLDLPASPHLSAEAEGVEIDLDRLSLPQTDGPLVVEGAGGVMVPLTLHRDSQIVSVSVEICASVTESPPSSVGVVDVTKVAISRSFTCAVKPMQNSR